MRPGSRVWRAAFVVVSVFVLVVVLLWLRGRLAGPATDAGPDSRPAGPPGPAAPAQRHPSAPPAEPTRVLLQPATQRSGQPPLAAEEAAAAYRRGLEALQAHELIQARSLMNKAYFSGKLPADLENDARRQLTELAETTLTGPRTTVWPGDPYAFWYSPLPGQVLASIERQLKLHVPWQIILKINGLGRPEDLAAGRQYKLIYGPFHAIIRKSAFIMDIYLHRQGLEKVFIRRVRIGTGKNGSTPAGMWRVRLGGKQEHPTWYPPPNSNYSGAIPYGHPDYAFGPKGLWIGLEGLDEHTRMLTDYGLHSTNDPASIGTARSLGCIRLADEDIELVYSLLYEHWSTVEVRP